jgi:tRNA pseudouridine55 synthase
MNGFLLIDKPSGITSSACVYKLRRLLNKKKIGHCGTLDPIATGILPICIGEATKFSKFICEQTKEYRATILFGVETDSGDISGQKISREDPSFSRQDLKLSLEQHIGVLEQVPPMHSALKYKGKPLHYWVRKGIYLKRESRVISVSNIELLSFQKNSKATIQVSCSKGTYIRSLAESIGRDLGSTATLLELRRTKVGSFGDKDLYSFEKGTKLSCQKAILDCDSMLKHLPKVNLSLLEAKKIRNGRQVDYNARQEKEGIVRIYGEKGSFIGLAIIDSTMRVSPMRLLNTRIDSSSSS